MNDIAIYVIATFIVFVTFSYLFVKSWKDARRPSHEELTLVKVVAVERNDTSSRRNRIGRITVDNEDI